MDPLYFLNCEDYLERLVMVKVADHWHREKEILDHNLAVEVVNALSKGMKK
jgi:hypothetical protein